MAKRSVRTIFTRMRQFFPLDNAPDSPSRNMVPHPRSSQNMNYFLPGFAICDPFYVNMSTQGEIFSSSATDIPQFKDKTLLRSPGWRHVSARNKEGFPCIHEDPSLYLDKILTEFPSGSIPPTKSPWLFHGQGLFLQALHLPAQ